MRIDKWLKRKGNSYLNMYFYIKDQYEKYIDEMEDEEYENYKDDYFIIKLRKVMR